MATLSSAQILEATVNMGVSKASQNLISRIANTVLAGMYIAIGGFLAIRVGLVLPWESWGAVGKLIFGAVFPLGLMLVVLCGADLFTGSCMTLTTAKLRGQISVGQSFL
ncbi:formate/nitrite transporter family protein, partial [Turicimonas muris]